MEFFGPKNILRGWHLLDDRTFELILPQEIYVPVTVASSLCKFGILYTAVQLFSEHFEGEKLGRTICFRR